MQQCVTIDGHLGHKRDGDGPRSEPLSHLACQYKCWVVNSVVRTLSANIIVAQGVYRQVYDL